MRPELQHVLGQEFPLLYQDVNIECGDGWFDLLKELSKKLYPLMEKSRMTSNEFDVFPYVDHVFEDYGSLRFYMVNPTDDMKNLIYDTEDRSQEICEICGEIGKIDFSKYWLEARCKTCRKP